MIKTEKGGIRMASRTSTVKVGLCSRIDYGGEGYRKGLVEVGFKIFAENVVKFIIVAGGLVAGRALEEQLREFINKNLAERKERAKEEGNIIGIKTLRAQLRAEFVDRAARELAEEIPTFDVENGVPVKIYLLTSKPHDKDIGREIALELTEIRSDILYYSKSDERFPTKRVGKRIQVLVPEKAQWRSKYASTPIDGILRENQERSAQSLADVYIVGCTGSYVVKPKGEARRDYMGLPMLSRPTTTVTSENQVGVVTLKLSADYDGIRPTNHSLKDLLTFERNFIPCPPGASRNQERIIEELRKGPSTSGVLSDTLRNINRDTVRRVLGRIMEPDGEWPGLSYDEASRRYDFRPSWLQHTLRYPLAAADKFKEDVIVAFGCLHAGSTNSDYEYFVEELPKFIEREKATLLVGAGDFVEGLKHNLMERGEVLAGMNYTDQEQFAARLVATVLLRVFNQRFSLPSEKYTSRKFAKAVKKALLDFVYIPGNHDEWQQSLGVRPTIVFHHELERRLVSGITDIVRRHRQVRNVNGDIAEIVSSKITNIIDDTFSLSSGVQLEVFHPAMARIMTTSLRAQHFLEKARKSQVIVIANFHTAVEVEEWKASSGQCIALQVGTNNHKTPFEERKGKVVDFGYGCVHVSVNEGRIVRSTVVFCGSEREPVEWSNEDIHKKFQKELGILD